ncbi:MAG: chemotaxis response regulator protein-glutamate methylesterase [Hyphomicrobiales bacterium]
MGRLATTDRPVTDGNRKIKVMLVDDSAVVRGLLSRWLSAEKNVEVVARCHNGLQAVREIADVKPTLVILDIEMPEMDGLEALPHLLRACPDARILIASSLSTNNAEISLTALAKGAHDYIAKPTSNSGLSTSNEFRVELITRINALCVGHGGRAKMLTERAKPSAASSVSSVSTSAAVKPTATSPQKPKPQDIEKPSTASGDEAIGGLRAIKAQVTRPASVSAVKGNLIPFKNGKPEILCIGSSTGGPRALLQVLQEAGPALSGIPVVLTQHMPKSFTTVFASHLDKACGLVVKEAEHGDVLKPGHVYVAPGDRHLVFEKSGGVVRAVLDDGPQVNFCKPAVDKMFTSVSQHFGNKVLSVILTGMGKDGVYGGQDIIDRGGNILVQDAESSIVWGMPGAAFKAGIASAQLPLNKIGAKIAKIVQEGSL